MILIPAIDLLGGVAVRLAEGDRERATVYDSDPLALVRAFASAGAARLHIVDLDGAFAGEPRQLTRVAAMIDEAHRHGLLVEVGGGVRTTDAALAVLDAGADLVIIGTMAVRAPAEAMALCERCPGRVIVAVDARDGRVAIDGWQERSHVTAAALALDAHAWGAAAILYTDVARDGLQVGANVAATAALQRQVPIPVIASGGVGTLADLDALRRAEIAAVVLGRALYEGAFTFKEAMQRC